MAHEERPPIGDQREAEARSGVLQREPERLLKVIHADHPLGGLASPFDARDCHRHGLALGREERAREHNTVLGGRLLEELGRQNARHDGLPVARPDARRHFRANRAVRVIRAFHAD